ncbi:MAG: thioredoxin domain-containing protein [Myxococcales bacterium]|nr:thioredoxin domain-containing protein [Myxococcales bacterium]
MKKEQAYMLFIGLFVVGYVAGRMTAPGAAPAAPGVAAPTAAQAAPAAVAAAQPAAPAGANTSAPPPPPPPPPPPAAAAKPKGNQVWRVGIHDDDAKRGPDSATVKVVVMSAFGCPSCSQFAKAMDQAVVKYGDQVQFRFKHKIIPPQHPDSIIAAEAAMAANAQGKFWQMHDKLMANTFAIDRLSLDKYAKELKLNMRKFKKAMDSHKYRGQLTRDSVLANEVGAHSFPNILANGVRIAKPKDWDNLQKLIDGELKRAEELKKKGATAKNLYEKAIAGGKFFPQYAGPKQNFNTSNSPTFGPKNAKIELVVFEDFQCPFCSKIAPNLKIFQKNNPKTVKIVYKHMPLTSIHADAQLASEASMAAHAQGKFWEYHDKLYANQQALKRADLERYASEIKLNMGKFKSDLDSGKHKAFIQSDASEGQRAGISGTPSVYINGYKYQGPRGYPPTGLEGVARMYLGL